MMAQPGGEDWSEADLLGRYVVRARRRADLSQRELAATLGVSRATVARIETGRTRPAAALLAQVLAIAGLRLAVVDEEGREVAPVSGREVRDNAGRRFPGHLEVAPPDEVPRHRWANPRYDRPTAQAWYHRREERDRLRASTSRAVTSDHPTTDELALRRQLMRGPQPRVGPRPAPLLECACPDACFLDPCCTAGCPCQCEPRISTPGTALARALAQALARSAADPAPDVVELGEEGEVKGPAQEFDP